MLSLTALDKMRDFIQSQISYAKYKVGSTYYQAPLRSTYVMPDGKLAITFLIDHSLPGTITITEVQLYDGNGNLWAAKAENIVRRSVLEGILYRFTFEFTEG